MDYNSKERLLLTCQAWNGNNRYGAVDIRYDLETNISDAITYLTNIEKDLRQQGWQNIKLEFGAERKYYDDDATPWVQVIGDRMETDNEFENRQKALKDQKKDALERRKKKRNAEYEIYLKLKKKFEKTGT